MASLLLVAGQLEEALLEARALRCQFVDREAELAGELADLLAGEAGDEQRPVVALDPAAALAQRRRQPLAVGGAHPRGDDAARRELLQRRLRDQLAVADHDQLVGDLVNLGEDVAGDEHGPALGRLCPQQIAQPAHPLRVEAVGRLVEDQDPRLAEQRRGQRQPLPHPQRVALHPPLGGAGQLDHLQHLVDPPWRDPPRRRQSPQVVAAAAAGVEGGRLERGADRLQRRVHRHRRRALDQHRAAARPQQPEQRPHRRRLAGPVRPEEAGHLPGLDREGEIVHGQGAAVALAQVADLQRRHPHPTVTSPPVAAPPAPRPCRGLRSAASCACRPSPAPRTRGPPG